MSRSTSQKTKLRRLLLVIQLIFGILLCHTITVGLVAMVVDSGHPRWLESMPGAVSILKAYAWPARCLSEVPGVSPIFQFSEDSWYRITKTPNIAIQYATHREAVLISEVPKDIVETFKNSCPDAEIVHIEKTFAGDRVIHWVFRFKQNNKLREALIGIPPKVRLVYDVQD